MDKVKQIKLLKPEKLKYNGKMIFMNTDKGQVSISYSDAFEITEVFLDATIGIDNILEEKLERIDAKYCLDKY